VAAAQAAPPLAPASDGGGAAGAGQEAARTVEYGDTVAWMEPFEWYTVGISGRPALVAMRNVRPAEGRLIQGFVISAAAVDTAIHSDAFAVRFSPGGDGGEEGGEREVAEEVGLEGVSWEVRVNADEAIASGRARAAQVRSDFLKLFWGGSASALIAAVFVVGMVAQTERLARNRSRFAASAAHELRTPLAGIRVYGEMLAENLGDPTKVRSYAGQVAAEAERLGRVVSNVLGYTRLERGTMKVRVEPGDLAESVREAAARLRPALEAAGATLEVEIGEAIPRVRFDRDALFQILQNLLDNAERYARGAEDRAIRMRVVAAGAGAAIEVSDRGPGISARQGRRLFRPFARGKDPQAPAGMGLGLAIVAALAKEQGASVRYSSRPGGGSIFEVAFPGPRRAAERRER
jgi:signal transduction histidine kinase